MQNYMYLYNINTNSKYYEVAVISVIPGIVLDDTLYCEGSGRGRGCDEYPILL